MLLLHILLFLLKLIGVVLLVILGLVVLILLIVLFSPVKYRIGASKYQTIQAEGKITWLFHLIEMFFKLDTGEEEGKRLHLSFRIAWFRLYDNQKPKEKRIKNKKTRKTKSKPDSARTMTTHQPTESSMKDEKHVPKLEQVQPEASEKAQQMSSERLSYTEKVQQEKAGTIDESDDEIRIDGPKQTLLEKIVCVLRRIKTAILSVIRMIFHVITSILGIPFKVMESLEKLEVVLTKLREKKEAFLSFYYEEHNHQWFTAFWQRLKKLILRILPKPDKLYLHFGFDDPATTGQVLGGLSILYPICGEKMMLCPEFAESILEGEVKFHGQIRLIRLVIFAIKSFLNKQFFTIVKQLKDLIKGE